jgi:hypothetical protein
MARSDSEHSPDWVRGYEAGFADGANDEMASAATIREAAEQALNWLESERDSSEPGATRPDEIIRVLTEALVGEASSDA